MAYQRYCRALLLAPLLFIAACASAEDRLHEGIELQTQGRYFDAAYRYIEALEKDETLAEARDRLISVGDSAVVQSMDDADDLERRGDPVRAAGLYRSVDRMLAAARQVAVRIPIPPDYSAIRRGVFDHAINWQMVQGDEAVEEGRWSQARQFYIGARGDYLPSRQQVEESYNAEERVLVQWAAIELTDMRPRTAYGLAQEALELRPSPARELVLEVRDIQAGALEAGTVIIAVPPVMADNGVREYLGGEFEIELDEALSLDYWNQPPLFVEVADPLVLRRELRGLLRGQVIQSPTLVGRALDLIGADLAVMVQLTEIEVLEHDVDMDRHEAVIERRPDGQVRRRSSGGQAGAEPPQIPTDTVTYTTIAGDLSYFVEADVILVDTHGREVSRFQASSTQLGPFQRGEFDGDPRLLDLDERRAPFFDPSVLAAQRAHIEDALLEELAATIATATYDQVLAGIR